MPTVHEVLERWIAGETSNAKRLIRAVQRAIIAGRIPPDVGAALAHVRRLVIELGGGEDERLLQFVGEAAWELAQL